MRTPPIRRLALLAITIAAMLSPSSVLGADPGSSLVSTTVREVRVSPANGVRAWEPSVAAHPTNANLMAAAYAHLSGGHVRAQVRISRDGGLTWKTTPAQPGGGGFHIIVAWGPGPMAGSARLYVANMTGTSAGLRLGTSYSDDMGAHWSAMKVQSNIPGWVGGTPDIITDNNPASPNYGTVYAAWNWPKSATAGPGLHVVASSNYGRTWHGVEIPALARAGYAASHRIGYRLGAAPDGSVYVSWYQAGLHRWRSGDPLTKGPLSNFGKIRIGIARLTYNRKAGTFSRGASRTALSLPRSAWNAGYVRPGGLTNDPQWTASVKVDPATGTVVGAVSVDGGIKVYRSTDNGATFAVASIPKSPAIGGRRQYIAKPDLVVGQGFMLVALRTLDRVGGTSGHGFSISIDGGKIWSTPKPTSNARWAMSPVSGPINGVGLRDRAAVSADGTHVIFVYGDGRLGHNLVAIYGARITVRL